MSGPALLSPRFPVMPVLLSCALLACAASGEEAETALGAERASLAMERPRVPTTAQDSALVRDAETAFGAWLALSALEPPPESPDAALWAERLSDMTAMVHPACDDGESYFPSPLLAAHALLPSSVRGDTVVARAVVTTVGEQDTERGSRDRYVARQRVRSDTLEWDVMLADDGRWRVCNGIRFGYHGADSLTRWTPEGASLASARQLADSIRRARQSAPLTSSGMVR